MLAKKAGLTIRFHIWFANNKIIFVYSMEEDRGVESDNSEEMGEGEMNNVSYLCRPIYVMSNCMIQLS